MRFWEDALEQEERERRQNRGRCGIVGKVADSETTTPKVLGFGKNNNDVGGAPCKVCSECYFTLMALSSLDTFTFDRSSLPYGGPSETFFKISI